MTRMPNVHELIESWRSEAEHLRERYSDERLARACEAHAQELEAALASEGLEALTLDTAEIESGYSRTHLRRLLREGKILNAGEPGNPRILRRSLPRKPGRPTPAAIPVVRSSRTQVARAVVAGG